MPTRQQVHIDRALTNVSVAYAQSADAFIADKVFPIIPVKKQSDTFFIYNKGDFFRDEARVRAHGTESAGGQYGVDLAPPYFCRVYAFHKDVVEEERVNSDDPLRPDQDSTEFVTQKCLLRREALWVEKYFMPGVWTNQIVGVPTNPAAGQTLQWDKPTSDPIVLVRNLRTKIAEQTGYKPNKLVLSPYVYNALCDHESIIDRIKYTQRGMVTKELMASLFEVDEILLPYAILNDAGLDSALNMKFMHGKHALLCYAPKSAGLKTPTAGYHFAWTGLEGAGAYGNRIVRIPMPWLGLDTERIEAEMAFDSAIIGQDLAYFLQDIVA